MNRKLTIPANACDSHIHIFDPNFREILPADDMQAVSCTMSDYRRVQTTLSTSRVVIVTPRNYDTDNSVTVDAIAQVGLAHSRGVAVLRPDVSDATLASLHAQGIRGIRFTLYTPAHAPTSFEMVEPLAHRISRFGWHLQLHWTADQILENRELLYRLPVNIVFDHLGRLPIEAGLGHPAALVIGRLMKEGRAWMKLSAPYLNASGTDQAAMERVERIARHWIGVAPDRVVWGTDWPHTSLQSPPDTASFMRHLFSWVDDQETLDKILVKNPGQLYWGES